MDALEKVKIYAMMLLEVINEAEKKREEEKTAVSAKERQMLIDLSGISVNAKPRADGRFQGYYKYDGKKHYVYGKSEQEVKIKIELFLKNGAPKKRRTEEQKKATPTVSEWLEKWIELYKAPNLKPATMRQLKGCLKPVIQRLGSKPLSSVNAEELQELLLSFGGERARDMCRGYLDQAFRKAVMRGIVRRNPCEAIEIKKHKSAHRSALTRQEQAKFLEAIKPLSTRPLFVFLLQTGLRIGEALALTYADIDFTQKTVSVSKNVVFIAGKRIDQDTPKSAAGVRVVPVPNEALGLLERGHDSRDLVFPFKYAGARSALRRISESLGFTVTAHLLRHTYATRLEEAGVSPKLKQYLMGHASLEMTQNTYTDIQPDYVVEQAERITGAFDTYLTPKRG